MNDNGCLFAKNEKQLLLRINKILNEWKIFEEIKVLIKPDSFQLNLSNKSRLFNMNNQENR
jgi:hypothetical protein